MKHLGSLKSTQEARVAHLSCSPNFLRASYLEERTLTYEPIVNQCALIKKLWNIALKWIKVYVFFKQKLQLWRSVQSDAKLTQSGLDHSPFLAFKASFLHLLCIPWAPCESYLCLKWLLWLLWVFALKVIGQEALFTFQRYAKLIN